MKTKFKTLFLQLCYFAVLQHVIRMNNRSTTPTGVPLSGIMNGQNRSNHTIRMEFEIIIRRENRQKSICILWCLAKQSGILVLLPTVAVLTIRKIFISTNDMLSKASALPSYMEVYSDWPYEESLFVLTE